MASIIKDNSTGYWTLKADDGHRYKLRKHNDEPRRPIPADVLAMASQHDSSFSSKTQTAIQADAPVASMALMPFIDQFHADYAKHSRKGSVTRLNGILRRFRWFLSENHHIKTVADVTEDVIMAFFDWRRALVDPRLKIVVKSHVVVSEIELLSGLFRPIKDNPVKTALLTLRKKYPKPKPEDHIKYLTPDEIRAFLSALDRGVDEGVIPLDYADLAKIMMSTGLRVEAAVRLDYSWVSKDWVVTVPSEHDKGKTGYSTVVADLGRQVLARRRGLQVAGRVFDENITADMSYYFLRKLCRRYGIEAKSCNHMMRHSFATALVDAGVPIQTISSLLGHKHVSTTQIYAKVTKSAKVEAVAKLQFG